MAEEEYSAKTTVELLIPVCHPDDRLDQLLHRMQDQTHPVSRVHLLITAEPEEYQLICAHAMGEWDAHYADFRTTRIAPDEFDHGGTRHLGASQSTADILLFMTQDAIPADEYLVERMVRRLTENPDESMSKKSARSTTEGFNDASTQNPTGNLTEGQHDTSSDQPVIAAVYARQIAGPDSDPIEEESRRFNYPPESRVKTSADLPELGIKTFFCSNVCAAWRRDVYEELGGFERHTIFNEDMIFAARLISAGYAVAYASDAQVIHSHHYSGIRQLRRNFDLAVSQTDHPEVFEGVSSESEGVRLVKNTAAQLCRSGKPYLMPKLIWQSGCKYLGYLLGRHYRSLPRWLVTRLTAAPGYWR